MKPRRRCTIWFIARENRYVTRVAIYESFRAKYKEWHPDAKRVGITLERSSQNGERSMGREERPGDLRVTTLRSLTPVGPSHLET